MCEVLVILHNEHSDLSHSSVEASGQCAGSRLPATNSFNPVHNQLDGVFSGTTDVKILEFLQHLVSY